MKRCRTDMSQHPGVHLPYGYYVRTLKGVDLRDLWIGRTPFEPPFYSWQGPVIDALAKLYYANAAGKASDRADPFIKSWARRRRRRR